MMHKRPFWLVGAIAALFSTALLQATPIDQATSVLDGAPNVLLTFDQDGDGTPLPVNIGTECFSPPFENCTLPADEYAGLGVTILPTTRISEDNSACFRSLVQMGGSGAFGLIASDTTELVFSPPVSAFEFWVVASASANLTITTYDQADQAIETVTFVGTSANCGFPLSLGYFGVQSTAPIFRATVSSGFGVMDQLRMVPALTEVVDLTLTSDCSYDPDVDRNWTIGNPNNFDVDVMWELSGTPGGTLTAAPGNNVLVTPTVPASDNVLFIMWNDELSAQQTLSGMSGGVACDDDGDGLSNKDEDAIGTDANNPDTDGDSLGDGEEVGIAAGSGCPDPLSADSDGDGVGDGTDNNICNAPPMADIVVEQLTDIGAFALVRLDGQGTSDDDPITDLNFVWLVDGSVVCDGNNTSCSSIEYPLLYGDHDITLIVTDSDGDSGSATTFVTLDPAMLSVLEIDFASVNFSTSNPRISIAGEIGLPFGVDYTELNPLVALGVDVADVTVLAPTDVTLTEVGSHGHNWIYLSNSGPVRALSIDWDGARFDYKQGNFPIKIKSQMISSSESIVQVTYKRKQIGDGFVLDLGNGATLTVDEDGNPLSNVAMEIDKPQRQVTLTLPFPITDASVMTISGFASKTINAANYLQASVGRYLLVAEFDPSLVPDGADNANRSIDFYLTVGNEAYYGGSGVGPAGTYKLGKRWISLGDN